MLRRLSSKNAIGGFGAWLLSLASFTAQILLEGATMINWFSPLAIAMYLTFVVGSFLICWSIFKPELSTGDKVLIIERRRQYLPSLQQLSSDYLTLTDRLAMSDELYNLEEYAKRLGKTRTGIIGKLLAFMEPKDPRGVLYGDIQREFLANNVIYSHIKDNMETKALLSTIDNLASQDRNPRLLKGIHQLHKAEHLSHSYRIFLKLSRDRFEPDILNEKFMFRAEKLANKVLWDAQTRLNKFIASLERGEDL
jgi:hypothetical protein